MLFCKHDWEIIVNEKTKSAVEVLQGLGMDVASKATGSHAVCRLTKYAQIHILKCKKCGRLKKFETYNHPY
jgi:Fe2+ or Zn2+ uptake regulation protein